jgi:FMN-dependent dehydrogenase
VVCLVSESRHLTQDPDASPQQNGARSTQRSDDVGRAKDYGVEGIYCTNHGGRPAKSGLPALNGLPAGAEAADAMAVLMLEPT